MKKLLTRTLVGAMLIGATVAGTSYAQNADRPHKQGKRLEQFKNMSVEERVDKRLAKMKEKLALTDAQAAQIRAILIEDGNRMKNAHEARKAARDAQKEVTKEQRQAARAEMKAQMDATKTKIEAILTAEQKAKAQTLLNDRKERMKKHMKGRRGDAQRGAQEVPQGQKREMKENQKAK